MSVLASNAFITMLHANITVVDGKQVVGQEKVACTLRELLQAGKNSSRKQAAERVRKAMTETLKDVEAPSNSVHAAFMGLYHACRVSQLVGIPCSLDRLPGMSEVVELTSAPPGAEHALVPASVPDGAIVETIESGSEDAQRTPARPRGSAGRPVANFFWQGHKRRRTSSSSGTLALSLSRGASAAFDSEPSGADGETSERNTASQEHAVVAAASAERDELAALGVPVLVNKLQAAQNTIVKRNQRIKQLQSRMKNLSKKLTAQTKKAERANALMLQQKADANVFELEKVGKGKDGRSGRWSLQSKLSMGFRCCLSTIAACDFGLVSMVDVSKQTVLRAERITGAALLSSMRAFCAEGLGMALSCSSNSSTSSEWSIFGVGFRSDATNTNIWRRKKLHVVEARAMYVADEQKLQAGDFQAAMASRSCVFLDASFSASNCHSGFL